MLLDKYNRKIDYLRVSVTDRCNLRCVYCMPACGIIHKPHQDLLSFEEIAEIVKAAVCLGIDKVRITGGEPLVRKDLSSLISLLNNIEGIKDISLTTNAVLLKEYASALKKAGLKRINISLDSLDPARYKCLSRGGSLEEVLAGISRSLEVGFTPLKINVLLLEGITEKEILDFLRLSLENPLCVRFLEFMPVNSFYKINNFISCGEVMDIAKRFAEIEETLVLGNGPARIYKF